MSILKSLAVTTATIVSVALSMGQVEKVQAVGLIFRAIGDDNYSNPTFYTVISSGDSADANTFISSISYDLRAGGDPDARFNPGNLSNSYGPVLNNLSGLSASDISFSFRNPSDPSILDISFAPGSFGVNESFRFGLDTELLTVVLQKLLK